MSDPDSLAADSVAADSLAAEPFRVKSGVFLRWTMYLIFVCALATVVFVLRRPSRAMPYAPLSKGVLPGEFEHQDALVFSWMEDGQSRDVIVSSIAAINQQTKIIVLARDAEVARQALIEAGAPEHRFRIIQAPVRSPWSRDFGPLMIKSFGGGYCVVDTSYGVAVEKKGHDDVPSIVAARLNLPLIQSPLVMENGNLLSNGAGLCLTTNKTVQLNESEAFVTKNFEQDFGATQVIFLEPLLGEVTGHIDMFATFTAADAVVVGEYAPGVDPANADILNRNAERLAEVKTACGPLRVFRIPMPPRIDGAWISYTNVAYANGTLLFPTFAGEDDTTRERAKSVYRELLPKWTIAEINCTELILNGGALHCATMNLVHAPSLNMP